MPALFPQGAPKTTFTAPGNFPVRCGVFGCQPPSYKFVNQNLSKIRQLGLVRNRSWNNYTGTTLPGISKLSARHRRMRFICTFSAPIEPLLLLLWGKGSWINSRRSRSISNEFSIPPSKTTALHLIYFLSCPLSYDICRPAITERRHSICRLTLHISRLL